MTSDKETKWTGRFGSWKYIPDRFQALVACITAGFLYFNVFEKLFGFRSGDSSCGSFFRPILTESDDYDTGWFWHSFRDAIANYADAFDAGSLLTRCPGAWKGMWWELIPSFAALAVCGFVLRRSIKRDAGVKPAGGGDYPTSGGQS